MAIFTVTRNKLGVMTCSDKRKECAKNSDYCSVNMNKVPLILCFVSCLAVSSVDGQPQQKPTRDVPWNFLLLAQFWPGTSCLYFGKYGCLVPPGETGWTIHGLWPSADAKKQPEQCNKSMEFNFNEIKPLQGALDQQWPYFNKSGDPHFLWAHEWVTHGTCAYDLPILQGELKYFNATLQLQSNLDIFGILKQADISPSNDTPFNLTDIFSAVRSKFGTNPIIKCFHQKHKYYLEQVYLCYDKTLTPRDCPEAHQYVDSSSKAELSKKPGPSLYFEHEKLKLGNSQTKSYFVDCSEESEVYYIPIPDPQTEVKTKGE